MKRLLLSLAVVLACLITTNALAQCGPNGCPSGPLDNGGWRGSNPPAVSQPVLQDKQTGHYQSVVRIRGKDARGSGHYYGSGCVIAWGDKIVVLTASHVVRGTNRVAIRGKTGYQECTVLDKNPTWDMAVLNPSNPSDLLPAEIAYADSGELQPGDQLESCGFGGNDKLKVNRGVLKRFARGNGGSSTADWLVMSGRARLGDSGGPIFRRKKLVGVLWGTSGQVVIGTQLGRIHVILTRVLGEPKHAQSRLLDLNLGLGCRPRPQPRPPTATQPYDPRVAENSRKLDLLLQQQQQQQQPPVVDEEEKGDKPNALIMVVLALGGVVLGFVLYFKERGE